MEGYATLPDGTRKWLIRIPDWDLNWQGVFRLKTPLFLPRGTVISMRYHYDNSESNPRNPNHPPKRVMAGNEATAEMSHFWLQVLPVADGDQRAALVESIAKQRLAKYPDDFNANYNMGDLLLNRGDTAGAITYFQKAAAADPRNVVAATELGVALSAASKVSEAEQQFRKALEIDPGYTDARFNLASVEAAAGNWQAAVDDLKQTLTQRPDFSKAQERLGEVLMLWGDALAKSGDDRSAVERYRQALAYRDSDPQLHGRLGMAFARMDRLDDSQSEFETILRLNPTDAVAKQAIDAIQARKRALGK
jgi:tetratricopeptide (TPR) repeat protein